MRVTAQLVDASLGFQVWSERFNRALADIFDVQDEIARAIVRRLKVEFAVGDAARLVKVTTTNMEAYQAYLQGRAMLYRRGPWIAKALKSFKRAVDLDGGYAQAWAGLADAQTVLCYSGYDRPDQAMPEALAAATRALELDPGSAEAHNALACASLMWERDFNKAEREFLHALALNPKYIQARCWYQFFLQWTVGRLEEGLAQARQALEADPLSAYAAIVLSFAWGTIGRADRALAYGKTAVEHDPQSFVGRWGLSFAHHWNGQYEEALSVLEALWAESPYNTWVTIRIVPAYARVGRIEKARAIYQELLVRRERQYLPPFVLAVCETALGDHQGAIASCAAAVKGRDVFLGFFHSGARSRAASGRSPLRRSDAAIQRARARVASSEQGRFGLGVDTHGILPTSASQQFAKHFAHQVARARGVVRETLRKHRRITDAKAVHAHDAAFRIDDRQGIGGPAHLGSAADVMIEGGIPAEVVFELLTRPVQTAPAALLPPRIVGGSDAPSCFVAARSPSPETLRPHEAPSDAVPADRRHEACRASVRQCLAVQSGSARCCGSRLRRTSPDFRARASAGRGSAIARDVFGLERRPSGVYRSWPGQDARNGHALPRLSRATEAEVLETSFHLGIANAQARPDQRFSAAAGRRTANCSPP